MNHQSKKIQRKICHKMMSLSKALLFLLSINIHLTLKIKDPQVIYLKSTHQIPLNLITAQLNLICQGIAASKLFIKIIKLISTTKCNQIPKYLLPFQSNLKNLYKAHLNFQKPRNSWILICYNLWQWENLIQSSLIL